MIETSYDKVVLIGTGRVACGCLKLLLEFTRDVVAIEPEQQPLSLVKPVCAKSGVAYRQETDREELASFFRNIDSPTLVISAHNIFIFPADVLANEHLNVVNFHNSLLPRHAGRNAPTWAIFEMDETSGVTWHQVAPAVDRGDIIAQRKTEVGGEDTGFSLTRRCAQLGIDVFSEILPRLLTGSYERFPQPGAGGSYHRAEEVPNRGVVDLSWSVRKVSAFLRSIDYVKLGIFPPARVRLLDDTYEVVKYELTTAAGEPSNPRQRELTLRDNTMLLYDGRTSVRMSLR